MKQVNFFIILLIVILNLIHSPIATADNSQENYAIQKFLVAEANIQGVDPALALAIAKVESDFNPHALSHAGAKGIMQIMPATAEDVFGVSSQQLFDAKTNIKLGVSFIKQLLARYNQRIDIALSHYNGGSAVQDKFGGLTVIPATQKYVNKVLSAQKQFHDLAYQLSNNNLTAKNILKPSYSTPSKSFDKSLYEKVEQLRTLRLHNIMRNTKNAALTSNETYYAARKPTKNRAKFFSKQDIPLSEKRLRILKWEKIFN